MMKPQRTITGPDVAALFDEAVHQRALAVLTVQTDDQWTTFKSRFLERDPQRRFFVLDFQAVTGERLPDLVPGQCIGVSFRSRSRKVLFASLVEARGHYMFDDRSSIPAIRYRWPDRLTELQRRAYFRTPVPTAMALPVSLWAGGVAARANAQGRALQVLTGTLADISCGGALVRLTQGALPNWYESQNMGIELNLEDGRPPAVLNGCFRGLRQDETGQVTVAIQFIGLEITNDGRDLLQRLATCVQRLNRIGIGSDR